MSRYVENAPKAEDLMESAGSFGNYNLAFSLADLIDNSISAGATRVDIFDDFDAKEIRITDNGCGMNEAELVANMRMGSRNPNSENKKEDLGRFGLGLKTASFSQARCLTVVSKKDNVFTAASWDLDDVKNWQMTVFSDSEAKGLASQRFPNGNGTEIIWTKLNRLLEDGNLDFQVFNGMMDEAEKELSLVFHRYMSGEVPKRPKLNISRNNRDLIAFDPFCRANTSTDKLEEETLVLNRGHQNAKIIIQPFILPHFTQLSNDEYEQLGGQEGYVKNQGFYIYREYRLIIRGTWFKLAQHGEFSKLARIRVDIPNSLDIDWRISVDKSEAELPWELRQRLKNLMATWVVPRAIRVYTKRKPKAKESVQPVWNRHNTASGVWSFSVNQLHPLIASFLSKCVNFDKKDKKLGMTSHFKEVVRLTENCLPLENIKSLMDDKPQSINGGYTDAQEVLDIAITLREALIADGHSAQYVSDRLKETAPFNEYFEQIHEYFKKNPIRI